ncbi:MAG: glutathione peroxidase [Marteilia pararefringens]
MASPKSFYNLQAQFLNLGLPGQAVSFEEFRNKPLIITNSACKCGLSATNFDQLKQVIYFAKDSANNNYIYI